MAEQFSPAVVLLGNDIHRPLNEMATWQAENICTYFNLAREQIVSLQSRKAVGPHTEETIVFGKPSIAGRIAQLVRMFRVLASFSPNRSRVIHFIGNGNLVLRLALTTFARLTRRAVVFSPVGQIGGPWPKHAVVLVPHRSLVPPNAGTNWIVLPPSVSADLLTDERAWQGGRLLFCSVPPKASELSERGVPQLLEIWREIEDAVPGATLTLLNRYSWMAGPLAALVERSTCRTVRIENAYIARMPEYLRNFDALVITPQAPHLAQVPQSALEACAAGVPCLVMKGVAFGEDIHESKAGAVYHDRASFLAGLTSIREEYRRMSNNARQLIAERFQLAKTLDRLGEIYRDAQFPYHGRS